VTSILDNVNIFDISSFTSIILNESNPYFGIANFVNLRSFILLRKLYNAISKVDNNGL